MITLFKVLNNLKNLIFLLIYSFNFLINLNNFTLKFLTSSNHQI
jgi:hypothetical protein